MLLHAYRRRGESITVDLDGVRYAFEPNDRGDVVGEVSDKSHAKHLVEKTDGYVKYGDDPAVILPTTATVAEPVKTDKAADGEVVDGPFVLRNDANERLDLADLDDAAVRKFAKAQGVPVANTMTGDKLRAKVATALKKV